MNHFLNLYPYFGICLFSSSLTFHPDFVLVTMYTFVKNSVMRRMIRVSGPVLGDFSGAGAGVDWLFEVFAGWFDGVVDGAGV